MLDRSFSRNLLRWYGLHRRDLPWRESPDPYRVWVSEVMLQQTTVRAVLPYFRKWLTLFPDLPSLARAPLRRVLSAWQGLGYYQRAKNLRRAARIILKDHGGRVPDDGKTLRTLPGFGPYTTAAVLSLAYGKPFPVVDANVRRVMMRILGLEGVASPRHDRAISDRLKELLPPEKPGEFNQAMMELGALVCRSRNPLCLACPVFEFCRAAREGRQEIIPKPRRISPRKIEAVVAVAWKGKRFLIQKRPPGGLFGDLWEFPGGKVEKNESLERALRREIREELETGVRRIRFLTTVRHAYTQFQVTLHVFSCELTREPEAGRKPVRWVTLRSVRRYPLPSGSVKIVGYLEGLTSGRRA
jgi:A/G-specific adenine glycosylase